MPKMSAREKQWQLEDDVRTLRSYAGLQSDEARFKAATDAIVKEQEQLNKALALSDVATMTAQEINTKWAAVAKALSG